MREIIGGIVQNAVRLFRPFAFVLMLAAVACHAQAPSAGGGTLPPELARRVEILIRSKASLPTDDDVVIGPGTRSDGPRYDKIMVLLTCDCKTSRPRSF